MLPKALALAGAVALVAIPASLHRGRAEEIALSRKGWAERALLAFVSIAFVSSIIWAVTPLLDFADYVSDPRVLAAGTAFLLLGLWLLYLSHAALSRNWSVTLEMRQGHQLVTQGIYRRVRHPMYLALLVYGLGQALIVNNWLAGPAYLVAIALMTALRIGPEERMMTEAFGDEYDVYRRGTHRLIGGLR